MKHDATPPTTEPKLKPIRTYETGNPRRPWAADRSGATIGYGMTEAEAYWNLQEGELDERN